MVDFTIVIPHRGNALGLWSTLHSCEDDIRSSYGNHYQNYNYVIVTNGETVLPPETRASIKFLEVTGRLLGHVHSNDPLTPPAARGRGAEMANGENIYFFDNHCLVSRGYFERAQLRMAQDDIDLLHSTTSFYAGNGLHYHYKIDKKRLEYNFWAESSNRPVIDHKPYMIAAGGHGGIVVKKSVWDDVGGYGPESLFIGYGGEELSFDLRLWRYGYKVWIDPKLIHYHYTGDRGYTRHYTDNYYTNMMVSANVVGGEPWLFKVAESFISGSHIHHGKDMTPMFDLMMRASDRSSEYSRYVDSRSSRTLDELLVWFPQNEVATA